MVNKRFKENEVEFIIIAWLLILYVISIVIGTIGLNNYVEFICSQTYELAFLLFARPILLIINVITDVAIFIFLIIFIFKVLSTKRNYFRLIAFSVLYILTTIINFVMFFQNLL